MLGAKFIITSIPTIRLKVPISVAGWHCANFFRSRGTEPCTHGSVLEHAEAVRFLVSPLITNLRVVLH